MRYDKYIKYLALLPLLSLFGCEADETPGTENQETVPVTIRLGVEGAGLSTRAAKNGYVDVPAGIDDDAIHSLDVYIYNEDGSEEVHLIKGDFNNDNIATTTLTTGKKTIRAIANAGEDPLSSPINALALISVDNGIPMSTTQDTTWYVSASQTEYEVRLNRMVAKMKVSIVDDRKQNPTIESFSITNLLPSITNLHRSKYGEVIFPSNVGQLSTWEWSSPNINTDGTTFYLHETKGTYNISLKLEGEDETRSTSLNKEIPRNYYFPLIVHITDFTPEFSGSYEYAPIGVLPIKVDITSSGREISLPEGASNVNITVMLKENGQKVTDGVTWAYPDDDESYFSFSETGGVLNITAQAIPAIPTGKYTLTATYEGRDHPFELTINIVDLSTITRSASNEAEPIIVEL